MVPVRAVVHEQTVGPFGVKGRPPFGPRADPDP
jgi:hypothetical protein